MIKFSETSHKNGLERLVEGLTGRQSEFIYLTENTRTSEFNQIIQRGKVPIIIPNELMAHHKVYKENADYLEFLVAIQAGRILYNSAAADVNDFQLYWDRLFEQNLIKDSDPVWNIDNFFKTFEHRPHLARTIFEIVESSRVNACLRRDYLGFKQVLEKVIPIKFQEMLNGFGELPKQALDNTVLTLLQYKLLLGYLPDHKIKTKQGDHSIVRAAQKKGIILKPFVERAQDLLEECYSLASPVLERNTDIGDSFIVTKKVHDLIFQNTKSPASHSSGASPEKLEGICGFDTKEHMVVASDINELEIFKDTSFKDTNDKEETPIYSEWDSIKNKYVFGFAVHKSVLRGIINQRTIVPDASIIHKLEREFSLLKPGGRAILKKQRSGEIDYERFVEYQNDVAAGITPDDRIYKKVLNRRRDVAALVLIDMSGSTNRWINEEKKIIDVMAEAVYYLSCGSSQLDDLVGVFGYSAYSRKKTEFYTIADFGEANPDNPTFLHRLSNICGQKQNHDGTAIRHATQKLLDTGKKDKLLIHLSDGEPEAVFLQKDLFTHEKDLPVYKEEYAWQDVRKALSEARARGILPICIRVNDQKSEGLERAYGIHYKMLQDPLNLQKVLCTTYKDLIA